MEEILEINIWNENKLTFLLCTLITGQSEIKATLLNLVMQVLAVI